MDYMFRTLRADEIDVRVSTVSEKGCSLLLYKDARCDMNILDETVGPHNWERQHYECKGNLFCKVSIYNSKEERWTSKSDCGAESYTEKEKGESSDSFKRACFNWGIGRELYTAPFIWVTDFERKQKNGKIICSDKFKLSEVEYLDRKISKLVIVNKAGDVVYTYGMRVANNNDRNSGVTSDKKQLQNEKVVDKGYLYEIATKYSFSIAEVDKLSKTRYKVVPDELTKEQIVDIVEAMETDPNKLREWLKNRTSR